MPITASAAPSPRSHHQTSSRLGYVIAFTSRHRTASAARAAVTTRCARARGRRSTDGSGRAMSAITSSAGRRIAERGSAATPASALCVTDARDSRRRHATGISASSQASANRCAPPADAAADSISHSRSDRASARRARRIQSRVANSPLSNASRSPSVSSGRTSASSAVGIVDVAPVDLRVGGRRARDPARDGMRKDVARRRLRDAGVVERLALRPGQPADAGADAARACGAPARGSRAIPGTRKGRGGPRAAPTPAPTSRASRRRARAAARACRARRRRRTCRARRAGARGGRRPRACEEELGAAGARGSRMPAAAGRYARVTGARACRRCCRGSSSSCRARCRCRRCRPFPPASRRT